MGFAVIQGYGLTETAPIVTLNHPFKTSKGSVGTPIAGVEMRIADDGEILVRGENVTSGYYEEPKAQIPKPNPTTTASSTRRLAAHRRHRRARRARAPVHQGPQEGNDRHARRAERVSRGRRARAQRAARRPRVGGRRRGGGRARSASTPCSCSSPAPMPNAIIRDGQRAAAGSSAHSRRVGLADRRSAAHRRHAQAETARDARLGAVGRAAGRGPQGDSLEVARRAVRARP